MSGFKQFKQSVTPFPRTVPRLPSQMRTSLKTSGAGSAGHEKIG